MKRLISWPTFLAKELFEAQDLLNARQKLKRIMRSKSSFPTSIAPGIMVEMYIKQLSRNRCIWSSLRIVSRIDHTNDSIVVAGYRDRQVTAAVEDIRAAISDDCFAQIIRKLNDVFNREIDYKIDIVDVSAFDGVYAASTNDALIDDPATEARLNVNADPLKSVKLAVGFFEPAFCSDCLARNYRTQSYDDSAHDE